MSLPQELSHRAYLEKIASSTSWPEKNKLIENYCRGKTVLDLGCVDHSYERTIELGQSWLHGRLHSVAKRLVGVDILSDAVERLRNDGYNIIAGDAVELNLDESFDVIVAGDLIEHVDNPVGLLRSIRRHMHAHSLALVSTPNPFSVHRVFQGFFDKKIPVNNNHTCWLCPVVSRQAAARANLVVLDFHWVQTVYAAWIENRLFKFPFNRIANFIATRHPLLRRDFMLVLGPGKIPG